MRNYSINWGKFLFIRWFPISWTLQAVHVLDKRERRFRIVLELIPITITIILASINVISWLIVFIFFIILHTLFWLFDSTWLVGFREVYSHFQGKGIQSVINFIDWSIDELKDCDNIATIAIYGGICRHKYHEKSDFDIRIVQDKWNIKTYLIAIKLRAIAIWKYKIPIDLKIVDSQEYLKNEMRKDEHPIIVYNKYNTFYDVKGDSYEILKSNPERFKKDYKI